MRAHCRAMGCGRSIPDGYLMCIRHWRMAPPEVRKAWSITWRQYQSLPTPAARVAMFENLAEVCRIVRAIERGQAA